MQHRGQSSGFVLTEVIVVLIISSVVVVALLAGLIALIRGLQPQNVRLGGESLPVAPTFGAFQGERSDSSYNLYPFGGEAPPQFIANVYEDDTSAGMEGFSRGRAYLAGETRL